MRELSWAEYGLILFLHWWETSQHAYILIYQDDFFFETSKHIAIKCDFTIYKYIHLNILIIFIQIYTKIHALHIIFLLPFIYLMFGIHLFWHTRVKESKISHFKNPSQLSHYFSKSMECIKKGLSRSWWSNSNSKT